MVSKCPDIRKPPEHTVSSECFIFYAIHGKHLRLLLIELG